MKFSIAQLALASCAVAAPTGLDTRAAQITDFDILNFALTLEHLENAFYKEGLAKFTADDFATAGYVPRYRFNLREVSKDEGTHVTFLTAAIKAAGGTPVKKCIYDFGLTDVGSFAGLASVLEGVGVSAYLGAAPFIGTPAYLSAAGAILTVEARHNAYIRDNNLPNPRSPFPAPFDTPLSLNEVYTLAHNFIVSCPKSNPPLPVKAFPAMRALNQTIARAGGLVKFQVGPKFDVKKPLFAAFAAVTGPVFTPVTKGMNNQVNIRIPKGVTGQSYVVLTDKKSVDDSTIVAGPAIIEIQPPYTIGGFP